MTVDEVLKYYKNQNQAAKALGIKRQAVVLWTLTGKVPLLQQYRYEILTAGKLKVKDDMLNTQIKALKKDAHNAAQRSARKQQLIDDIEKGNYNG